MSFQKKVLDSCLRRNDIKSLSQAEDCGYIGSPSPSSSPLKGEETYCVEGVYQIPPNPFAKVGKLKGVSSFFKHTTPIVTDWSQIP